VLHKFAIKRIFTLFFTNIVVEAEHLLVFFSSKEYSLMISAQVVDATSTTLLIKKWS